MIEVMQRHNKVMKERAAAAMQEKEAVRAQRRQKLRQQMLQAMQLKKESARFQNEIQKAMNYVSSMGKFLPHIMFNS